MDPQNTLHQVSPILVPFFGHGRGYDRMPEIFFSHPEEYITALIVEIDLPNHCSLNSSLTLT